MAPKKKAARRLQIPQTPENVRCAFSEMVPIASLVPHPLNPNQHPPEQIRILSKIIAFQGWRSPIVVSNRSGFIIRGHGRLEAAHLLDLAEVPVDRQDYENEAAEWADMIADNRIAELAELDASALGHLADELRLADADFDFELAGFTDEELNGATDAPGLPTPSPDDGEGEEGGVKALVGEYSIALTSDQYLSWLGSVRDRVGFEKSAILTEIKRRLKL